MSENSHSIIMFSLGKIKGKETLFIDFILFNLINKNLNKRRYNTQKFRATTKTGTKRALSATCVRLREARWIKQCTVSIHYLYSKHTCSP